MSALLPKVTKLPDIPLKSPIVIEEGVMALMSNVAPEALVVTAPAAAKEPEPDKERVPAEIVVPPV